MKKSSERATWDEYFMKMALLASTRSTCIRRKVGAVAVLEKRIIATGYNGAPRGVDHCSGSGKCLRNELGIPSGQRDEICMAVHAEQNIVAQCALHGQSMRGATIYCVNKPCFICFKLLVNAGVSEIVYLHDYDSPLTTKMWSQTSIRLRKIGMEDSDEKSAS